MRSPKAKFRIEINFAKPLVGIGSVMSYTDDNIDTLRRRAVDAVKMGRCAANIVIMENKATFPSFDWQRIDAYTLDKDGNVVNMYRQRLGKRIAQLRNEAGMSQARLAELTGMEQPHIARIEAGRYSVGVDILGKIATALGKRVDIVD